MAEVLDLLRAIDPAEDAEVPLARPHRELAKRLTGWAGYTDMLPLLQRLGGDAAVVATAREIAGWGHGSPALPLGDRR